MMIMEEITEAFDCAQEISVYREGCKTTYSADCRPYGEILSAWREMIACARPMPAYGVSLNAETLQAREKGLWVEFSFGAPCVCYDMPFEKLLVEVERSHRGFNLIRYNAEGGYDGRCFYLDLAGGDMSALYRTLELLV